MSEKKEIPIQYIEGIPFGPFFKGDLITAAKDYEPNPTDVFVITYPKSGTNWMCNILSLILLKGQPPEDFTPKGSFLEMFGKEMVEKQPHPRIIFTHLPPRLLKISPSAKYVFVARNPKDTLVSYYHHVRKMYSKISNFDFDHFFEIFLKGENDFGDYFDFYDAWEEYWNKDNFAFFTYEEIKADTRSAVLKLAKFLGPEYQTALEEDDSRVEKILEMSTVDSMKVSVGRKLEKIFLAKPGLSDRKDDIDVSTFVRKGVVGDWKNHLSEDQVKRLEEKFRERTKGKLMADLWKE